MLPVSIRLRKFFTLWRSMPKLHGDDKMKNDRCLAVRIVPKYNNKIVGQRQDRCHEQT
jgi:hypothetical protein